MFKAILEAIKAHDTIIIHRHTRPDGDAMGSQIGMKELIRTNFPEKTVYAVGDSTGYLSFMPGSRMDTPEDSAWTDALAILLDSSSPQLISDERWKNAKMTARIDHHIYQGKFTDVEVTDESYESCCGLISQFAMETGLRLTADAARALYTGLITDSGRFRYDCTNARTFRLAAFLREQEFSTEEIFRGLYSENLESKQLRAGFIQRICLSPARVAWIYTTREDLRELGMDTFSASRGMANVMADLKGVEIWVNFTEADEGVLCELRSSGRNINPVAVKYGGGGHAKASGATVPDRATAMQLLDDLDRMMGETL